MFRRSGEVEGEPVGAKGLVPVRKALVLSVLTVLGIPCQRMAQMGQVGPDLVGAPGVKDDFQQAETIPGGQNLVFGKDGASSGDRLVKDLRPFGERPSGWRGAGKGFQIPDSGTVW